MKKNQEKKDENTGVSLDTKIALNLFENLEYDLDRIRQGQSVKPVYLSKLPKDLGKLKSTKKKDTFIKIIIPLIIDENNKILENRKKLFKILNKQVNSMGKNVGSREDLKNMR